MGPQKDTSSSDDALPGRETDTEHSTHLAVTGLLGGRTASLTRKWGQQAAGLRFPACSLELLSWKEAKGNVTGGGGAGGLGSVTASTSVLK